MIDFNEAEEQREGQGSAIPEDSIIPFKMTLRPPKTGKEGPTHAMFSKSPKGNEYLDCEFDAQGKFEGRKIWQNFVLVGSDQAAKISMRTLRAIVESARAISPSDHSPQATEGRKLSDWLDFNGMVFLAKIGCKVELSAKDGQYYVNNEFKKIITPDDPEYAAGEYISDKPLPTIPDPTTQPQPKPAFTPAAGGMPSFGLPATTAPPQQSQPSGASPIPSWAQR
jgi:hypothetical protein